jgi:hypothetical protein
LHAPPRHERWTRPRVAASKRAQDTIANSVISITITLRHAIWRVWRDGVFYGDYRSKQLAIDAAEELARSLAACGITARII